MYMKRLLAGLICLALLSGCSTLDSAASKDPVTRTGYVLGTVVTIKLLDRGSEALLDRCFERLAEIESLMSVSIEGSDVFELNRLGEYRVSDDTFKVIKAGLEYGALSQGRFDISLGPVIDLWKIGTEEAQIPTKEALTNALEKVDFTSIMTKEHKRGKRVHHQLWRKHQGRRFKI